MDVEQITLIMELGPHSQTSTWCHRVRLDEFFGRPRGASHATTHAINCQHWFGTFDAIIINKHHYYSIKHVNISMLSYKNTLFITNRRMQWDSKIPWWMRSDWLLSLVNGRTIGNKVLFCAQAKPEFRTKFRFLKRTSLRPSLVARRKRKPNRSFVSVLAENRAYRQPKQKQKWLSLGWFLFVTFLTFSFVLSGCRNKNELVDDDRRKQPWQRWFWHFKTCWNDNTHQSTIFCDCGRYVG